MWHELRKPQICRMRFLQTSGKRSQNRKMEGAKVFMEIEQKQSSHHSCHRCGCRLYEKTTYFFRICGDRIVPFCSVRCIEAWLEWSEHSYEKCDTGLESAWKT